MEKLYYITLYLLGIQNEDLVNIINIIPKEEVKQVLLNDNIEIQYKYGINLSKYTSVLSDSSKVNKCVNDANKIIHESRRHGINIIPINSTRYPRILKEIKNPPAIIYSLGKNITRQDEKSVGCVGSRNATDFGINATHSIVQPLTDEGFTIISGLATGIDAESHKVCLKEKGRTIAVLAHGLDQIYPKENEDLAIEILGNEGTLVSEYPIGTKPDKFRFVQRNRIISGLSKGIILFESKEKSGSMHTVNYSLESGKPIFCPYPTTEKESVLGLLKLIKSKKAIPLTCKNDYRLVINKLGYKLNNRLERTNKVKNQMIRNIKQYDNDKGDLIDIISHLQFDKYSTIKTNEEIHNTFKDILKKNNLTLQEFFNSVIISIVNNYKLED